jgi:hypothetical protein
MNCLNDKKKGESNRRLLTFCKEPRTPGEMLKASIKGDVMQILIDLLNAGALSFADGKYYATAPGLEALQALQ